MSAPYQPTRRWSPSQELLDRRTRSQRRDPVSDAQTSADGHPPYSMRGGLHIGNLVNQTARTIEDDPHRQMVAWVQRHWLQLTAAIPQRLREQLTLITVNKLPGNIGELVILIEDTTTRYAFRAYERQLLGTVQQLSKGKISKLLISKQLPESMGAAQ